MGTEWAEKTPSEILADLNAMFTDLPTAPDISKIYVSPMHWALFQSWRLYWHLRDQGVHWRRAKRMRRREWERLKREARRAAERHRYDEVFEQVLADHPVITDYLARH